MDEATRISLKDQFNSLLVRAIEGRRGGMALMRVLEELDFYNSPASAKHHLNVPGGLVLHSLNVARAALELCDKMPQFAKCNKDAVLTAALLHDVCKAGQYIKKPDGSYRYAVCDTRRESAGVVVFERKGTEWNFEPCIPQGEEVTGLTTDCYSWHDRMVATKPCGGGAAGSLHNEDPQRM